MKQLRKIKLSKHAEVLDYDQMQHIVGGYSSGSECPDGKVKCDCDGKDQGCLTFEECLKVCGMEEVLNE